MKAMTDASVLMVERAMSATKKLAHDQNLGTLPPNTQGVIKSAVQRFMCAGIEILSSTVLELLREQREKKSGDETTTSKANNSECLTIFVWNMRQLSSDEHYEAILGLIKWVSADIYALQGMSYGLFKFLQTKLAELGYQMVNCVSKDDQLKAVVISSNRLLPLRDDCVCLDQLMYSQLLRSGDVPVLELSRILQTDDDFQVVYLWDREFRREIAVLNVSLSVQNQADVHVAKVCAMLKYLENSSSAVPFFIAGDLKFSSNEIPYKAMVNGSLDDLDLGMLSEARSSMGMGLNPLVTFYRQAFTHGITSLESAYLKAQGCEALAAWRPLTRTYTEGFYLLHDNNLTAVQTVMKRTTEKEDEENPSSHNLVLHGTFSYI